MKALDIAVIGGGVAGLTAAYLLQKGHRVTLLEKNNYAGGHTNTLLIPSGPDKGTPVDTGFIVLNDKTYPTFHRLLARLGVAVRWSDMSFGYHCEQSGLQYAGTDINGLFAQRKNLFSGSYLRMLWDIARFCRRALRDLDSGSFPHKTLGRYVEEGNYGQAFARDYLIPMGSAIWSTSPREMLDFPAETFARFFFNHGLLSFSHRPRWQTVVGGSRAYVQALLENFSGHVRLNAGVRSIRRLGDGVDVHFKDGTKSCYDRVIVAAHADEALALLEDPSAEERQALGAWTYQKNHTVLHTDVSVLPTNPKAWASWNYAREAGGGEDWVSVTYDMNRLQGLKTKHRYCVTLNRAKPVAKSSIICELEYTHPTYTYDAVRSQVCLPDLNGKRHTYYCGSYFGYGFHEDAVKSGVAVARLFGYDLMDMENTSPEAVSNRTSTRERL